MVGGWWRRAFAQNPVRAAVAVAVAATVLVGTLSGLETLNVGAGQPGIMALTPEDLSGLGLPLAAYDAQGVLDRDLDGVADVLENILYGTDPANATTGGVPVPDGWMLRFGFQPGDPLLPSAAAASPPVADLPRAYGNTWPARFMLSLAAVYAHGRPASWNESADGPFDSGLDPRKWDNDGDAIPDGWLIAHGLDPLGTAPSDRPAGAAGLTVAQAFEHATDPRKVDTDGDGLTDADEIAGPPNGIARWPPSNPRRPDSGGAGVCDGYLAAHGLDPSQPSSSYSDHDNDGATTLLEHDWSRAAFGDEACRRGAGLDPRKASSGPSKIPDGWLIAHGQDPLSPGVDAKVTQRASTDPRPSAPAAELVLTVWDEYVFGRPGHWSEAKDGPWMGGTDPATADSDGDGLGDAWEQAGVQLAIWPQPGVTTPSLGLTTSDPTAADSDGDGASDAQEASAKTDPQRPDTDFDGLTDTQESQLGLGLDPRRADSAGDLLRDGERYELLLSRVRAYAADPTYEFEGQAPRSLRDWVSLLPGAIKEAGTAPVSSLSDAALLGLLDPSGDLDGDGVQPGDSNLLDADMDGDGILNGYEVHPELYAQSSFDLPDGFEPATDPLNPDTDGDLLPDGWELANLHRTSTGVTLDPSLWDTDGDDLDDGAEDPDDDGIVWTSYTPQRTTNTYLFTNVREHRYGTDPNKPFTDGDGLLDGWKAFWGIEYASLPPAQVGDVYPNVDGHFRLPDDGLPRVGTSQPASHEDSLILQAPYERYSLAPPAPGSGETELGQPIPVSTSQGTRSFHRLLGRAEVRFQDAQAWGTNPYLADTDGDGMPDWWEVRAATVPHGVDGALAQCITGPGPHPLEADGPDDPEGDGLGNAREFDAGSHPLCADTDMAGVGDGTEADRLLDPADPTDDASLRDATLDTDSDGLRDFVELTQTGTRYDDPDSDGDGLLDGPTRRVSGELASLWLDLGIAWQASGEEREFLGEADPLITTDPRNVDDYGAGVPAGWVAMRLSSPLEAADAFPYYALGRPAWWREPQHGPWWGGADPRTEILGDLRHRLDLDGDGLDERDESGAPADDLHPANPGNVPRAVAAPPTLPGLQTRLTTQAGLAPAPYLAPGNAVAHPVHDEASDTRTSVCLHAVQANDAPPDSPSPLVVGKGDVVRVTGIVRSCASQAGLAGVAVQAFLGGQSLGAGVSQPGGSFGFDAKLDGSARFASVPDGALTALRGVAFGPVQWEPDAAAIPVGAATLVVRSSAGMTLRPAEVDLPLDVQADPSLTLIVPTTAATGDDIAGRLVLVDGAGVPLLHAVRLHWDGADLDPVMPRASDGGADFTLPAVDAGRGGEVRLAARTLPPAGSPIAAIEATADVDVRRPGTVEVADPRRADAGAALLVRGQVRAILSPSRQEGVPAAQVEAELRSASGALASTTGSADAAGRFDLHLPLPEAMARGTYQVVVKAQAPGLADAESSADVQVRARPRFLQVDTSDVRVGEPVAVTGLLLEPQGTPVADTGVAAVFDGRPLQGQTDEHGRFTLAAGQARSPGAILQSLTSQETETHLAANHRSERLASTLTTLTVDDGTVARGAPAHVKVVLRQADGAGVPGAAIFVKWGNEPARLVVTGAEGSGVFTRPAQSDAALGEVVVSATYPGLAGQAPSAGAATWSVKSLATILLPSDSNLTAGSPALRARLVDAGTQAPLAGRDVIVEGPAGSKVRQTDDAGRFILVDGVPAHAAPGQAVLAIRFAGEDGYPPVQATTAFAIRSAVELTCSGPAAFVAGHEAGQVCQVLDARGLSVPSGMVSLVRDGVVATRAPVRDGAAHLPVSFPAGPDGGSSRLLFTFDGTATHAPANATATVTILRAATIRAVADVGRVGQLTTLRFEVTDDAGPLADHALTVFLAGDDGIRLTTDETGRAELRVRQTEGGLAFLVRSSGQGGLAPAATAGLVEAKPLILLPDAASALPLAAAAAVAVLGIAAATVVALRARATPLERALRSAHRILSARGPVERRILEAYRELEEGAIGLELLQAPAHTARTLEERLRDVLDGRASEALDRLITLFEEARYGARAMPDAARRQALAALSTLRAELRRGIAGEAA